MILKDWYADYPDAEDFLYPLLHSANKGAGGNVSFYANPRFDSIVTASRRELDEAKRNALYRRPTRSRSPTRRWCFCISTTSCMPCSPGSSTSCRR